MEENTKNRESNKAPEQAEAQKPEQAEAQQSKQTEAQQPEQAEVQQLKQTEAQKSEQAEEQQSKQKEEQQPEQAEAQQRKHKTSRAERKKKRKAKKAEKRNKRKEAYKGLSLKKKVWYWLKRVLIAVVAVGLLGFVTIGLILPAAINAYYEYSCQQQASEEELLAIAAPDEEGAATIDAMKENPSGDTWAIYVYMSGSNLESHDMNELSSVTKYLLEAQAKEFEENGKKETQKQIQGFVDEINEQGIDLPDYMYLQEKQADAESETDKSTEEYPGCASTDIDEMLAVDLPENVKIVYQTGGSPRWSHIGINPNRTQRFLYDQDGFRMIEENPVQNMGEVDTLKDFLTFCKKDYSADHQMLIFWNHGGGAFGFCWEDLFGGDHLSLKELTEALSAVYPKNEAKPPLEIIGFDACLMASLETAEALNGYGQYLVASEELEPGEGWDYTAWLGKLAEHPEMNGAQLSKAIVDSYIEYYANQSIQLDWLGIDYESTLSVVDIAKAHETYEAYGAFAKQALQDCIKNPAAMAALGRAAASSIRYGEDVYNIFNTIDLGLFMDNMSEYYPERADVTAQAVRDCVLYSRATSYARESQGISVYFPTEIENLNSLRKYINYVEDICENQDIRALYYYKFGGCLNKELQAYAESQGYGEAKPLDTAALDGLASVEVEVEQDGNFSMSLDAQAIGLIQDYTLNLAKYDEDTEQIIYYGEDCFLGLEDTGRIFTDFDGEWMSIDGHMLAVEIIDETASMIRYRAPVLLNGEEYYLILAYDFDQEEISILGASPMSDATSADVVGRNVNNLRVGDRLQPIYESNYASDDAEFEEYGKKFRYSPYTKIEDHTLENGTYMEYITVRDTRGDEYYSPVVQFKVQGGKITEAELREDMQNSRTSY